MIIESQTFVLKHILSFFKVYKIDLTKRFRIQPINPIDLLIVEEKQNVYLLSGLNHLSIQFSSVV